MSMDDGDPGFHTDEPPQKRHRNEANSQPSESDRNQAVNALGGATSDKDKQDLPEAPSSIIHHHHSDMSHTYHSLYCTRSFHTVASYVLHYFSNVLSVEELSLIAAISLLKVDQKELWLRIASRKGPTHHLKQLSEEYGSWFSRKKESDPEDEDPPSRLDQADRHGDRACETFEHTITLLQNSRVEISADYQKQFQPLPYEKPELQKEEDSLKERDQSSATAASGKTVPPKPAAPRGKKSSKNQTDEKKKDATAPKLTKSGTNQVADDEVGWEAESEVPLLIRVSISDLFATGQKSHRTLINLSAPQVKKLCKAVQISLTEDAEYLDVENRGGGQQQPVGATANGGEGMTGRRNAISSSEDSSDSSSADEADRVGAKRQRKTSNGVKDSKNAALRARGRKPATSNGKQKGPPQVATTTKKHPNQKVELTEEQKKSPFAPSIGGKMVQIDWLKAKDPIVLRNAWSDIFGEVLYVHSRVSAVLTKLFEYFHIIVPGLSSESLSSFGGGSSSGAKEVEEERKDQSSTNGGSSPGMEGGVGGGKDSTAAATSSSGAASGAINTRQFGNSNVAQLAPTALVLTSIQRAWFPMTRHFSTFSLLVPPTPILNNKQIGDGSFGSGEGEEEAENEEDSSYEQHQVPPVFLFSSRSELLSYLRAMKLEAEIAFVIDAPWIVVSDFQKREFQARLDAELKIALQEGKKADKSFVVQNSKRTKELVNFPYLSSTPSQSSFRLGHTATRTTTTTAGGGFGADQVPATVQIAGDGCAPFLTQLLQDEDAKLPFVSQPTAVAAGGAGHDLDSDFTEQKKWPTVHELIQRSPVIYNHLLQFLPLFKWFAVVELVAPMMEQLRDYDAARYYYEDLLLNTPIITTTGVVSLVPLTSPPFAGGALQPQEEGRGSGVGSGGSGRKSCGEGAPKGGAVKSVPWPYRFRKRGFWLHRVMIDMEHQKVDRAALKFGQATLKAFLGEKKEKRVWPAGSTNSPLDLRLPVVVSHAQRCFMRQADQLSFERTFLKLWKKIEKWSPAPKGLLSDEGKLLEVDRVFIVGERQRRIRDADFGTGRPSTGGPTEWLADMVVNSVEACALHWVTMGRGQQELGWQGAHLEGSWASSLFAILLGEILFYSASSDQLDWSLSYLSPFQTLPLDYGIPGALTNRLKQRLDRRLEEIEGMGRKEFVTVVASYMQTYCGWEDPEYELGGECRSIPTDQDKGQESSQTGIPSTANNSNSAFQADQPDVKKMQAQILRTPASMKKLRREEEGEDQHLNEEEGDHVPAPSAEKEQEGGGGLEQRRVTFDAANEQNNNSGKGEQEEEEGENGTATNLGQEKGSSATEPTKKAQQQQEEGRKKIKKQKRIWMGALVSKNIDIVAIAKCIPIKPLVRLFRAVLSNNLTQGHQIRFSGLPDLISWRSYQTARAEELALCEATMGQKGDYREKITKNEEELIKVIPGSDLPSGVVTEGISPPATTAKKGRGSHQLVPNNSKKAMLRRSSGTNDHQPAGHQQPVAPDGRNIPLQGHPQFRLSEIKSPNDHLSDKQIIMNDLLTRCGFKVEVIHVTDRKKVMDGAAAEQEAKKKMAALQNRDNPVVL